MSKHDSSIILKAGREAAVLRRHPWVFSGGIARVQGNPEPGDVVAVLSSRNEFLAWGHYSPASQIRVRLVSWREDQDPDTPDFWRGRLQRAIGLREALRRDPGTTAYRLVHAESDWVPGLIADLYGDTVVVQLLTAGAERRRTLFTGLLDDLVSPRTLYERSDVDVRERENLAEVTGLLHGEPLEGALTVSEGGLAYLVDVRHGHKTGFYLDQRENRLKFRALAGTFASTTSSMLNVFAYTGAFTVCGLAEGIGSAVNVDSSVDALATCRLNLEQNQLEASRSEDIAGNAFEVLRRLRGEGRRYDMIVLDPPKFAFTKRDVQKASRGYKDINMQAVHLLKPGGLLFTFSCSGAISEDLFQKIVFGAALDTGRSVQITGRLSQGSDHPVALEFPEGAYLKGLICRAVD